MDFQPVSLFIYSTLQASCATPHFFIVFFEGARLSCNFLKMVLSSSSPGFLEAFQSLSLYICCFFIHFQFGPCTWPFSEEDFSVFFFFVVVVMALKIQLAIIHT